MGTVAISFAVVAGTAGFVFFVFALTILLDYPFSSDPSVTQVTTSPYKDATLAQFWPRDLMRHASEGPIR